MEDFEIMGPSLDIVSERAKTLTFVLMAAEEISNRKAHAMVLEMAQKIVDSIVIPEKKVETSGPTLVPFSKKGKTDE